MLFTAHHPQFYGSHTRVQHIDTACCFSGKINDATFAIGASVIDHDPYTLPRLGAGHLDHRAQGQAGMGRRAFPGTKGLTAGRGIPRQGVAIPTGLATLIDWMCTGPHEEEKHPKIIEGRGRGVKAAQPSKARKTTSSGMHIAPENGIIKRC